MAQLDWHNVTPVVPAHFNRAYFDMPAFEVEDLEWKGASEIVRQFNFTSTKNFALRRRPTKPTDVNYGLCIRYRVGDVVTRYKLWDDDDFQLPNVEMYNGQIIKKNFVLEIWSFRDETTAVQEESIRLNCGIRQVITDFSQMPADYADATGTTVTLSELQVAADEAALGHADDLAFWFSADVGIVGDPVGSWGERTTGTFPMATVTGTPSEVDGFAGSDLPGIVFIDDDWMLGGVPGGQSLRAVYLLLKLTTWASGAQIYSDGARVLTMAPTPGWLRCTYKGTDADIDVSGAADGYLLIVMDQQQQPNVVNRIRVFAYTTSYNHEIGNSAEVTGDPATPNVTEMSVGNPVSTAHNFMLAELLAYSIAPNTVEDEQVRAYLAAKYTPAFGLSLNIPSGSPWLSNDD